ncbi:hypothetical protein [Allosalinactinospora lopnorensis]|uniref:hypothetical protein n=1 Tax=Allosalinactinospora lopnorensis TaxID=1352348 RepID=UPI000623E180|nr:hypothetical protein [Allosalinactinospora lopnorensis]
MTNTERGSGPLDMLFGAGITLFMSLLGAGAAYAASQSLAIAGAAFLVGVLIGGVIYAMVAFGGAKRR